MRIASCLVLGVVLVFVAPGRAADLRTPQLSLQKDDESVYAPPSPPSELDLYNQGGVNLSLQVRYMTDYVFRGIDRSETGGSEDAPNLQFDGTITFNLGNRVPHPFMGIFVNVYNSDPISRFQEIRPYFGTTFELRPFIFEAGHHTFIFPERDENNTSEFYVKVTLMDEVLLRSAEPFLRPYALAAYDYDKYRGWYYEAGVEHVFRLERTGFTLTAQASAAYVVGVELFTGEGPLGEDTGFQRYQVGLIGEYSLNSLLNIARRYGQWSIVGYGYYTDNLSNRVRADTQVWGGGGIEFRY